MLLRWGVVLLLFLLTSGQALALKVDILPQASVDNAHISLSDVASIDPSSNQLLQLRLGRSPSPGGDRDLDRRFIARALQRAGIDLDSVVWGGAEVVKVKRAGNRITPADIEASVDTFFAQQQQRLPDADIQFEPYREYQAFVVPKGRLQVEVVPAADNLLSSRSLTLIYRVDGHVVENLTIRGKISAKAEIAVANSRIRRGSTIQPGDVSMLHSEISDINEPVFSLAEVIGKELGRSVRVGDPIDGRHLQAPVIIERGAYVKIIAERGPMRIEASGSAREDGRLGETIRVRNSSSLEEIHAEVVGANTVKVRF